MTAAEISKLKQRKAALEERLQVVKRKEAEARRKADTRRKIVVGGAVIREVAERPEAAKYVAALLRRRVTDRDRDLVVDLMSSPDASGATGGA